MPAPIHEHAAAPAAANDAGRATAAIGPRRRWWRVAIGHLQAALRDPIRQVHTRTHRTVLVMGGYGIHVNLFSANVSAFLLVRRGPHLEAWEPRAPRSTHISLLRSPATAAFLEHIVDRDAAAWQSAAGASDLDARTMTRLRARLCSFLWWRWSADGTLAALRATVAAAFALDPEIVHLARQITRIHPDADDADERDYNRALADRESLLTLEREAPALVPLFAALLHAGECAEESKRAMRRAFVERFGAPRHWRRFVALAPESLELARRGPRSPRQHPLLDLAELITSLDSPIIPPREWLQSQLDACGGSNFVAALSPRVRVAAMRAHLQSWTELGDQAHDRLLVEMQVVDDWIDSQHPPLPEGPRPWTWWARQALAWDHLRRLAALAAPAKTRTATPIVRGDLELRPLLSAVDLHDEARAMAHCLDRWRTRVGYGTAAAWSVRDATTGQRVATAGVSAEAGWTIQVRGFANRVAPQALVDEVRKLLAVERQRLIDELRRREEKSPDA